MAGLKKDVELIFRGEDRASPTIKGVRDSVRGLTGAISEQVAAAERGDGSIDDLAKSYKRLKDAQGDVGEIVKLAAAYDNLTAKHAEQAAKAEEARQKEAALSAEIAAAAKPTKRLQSSRDSAARSAATAAAKEAELAAQVKLAGEAFEAAGGDVRNFEASQEAIRGAALETARALKQAGDAMDGYAASAARGAKVKAGQAEAVRFDEMAAGSGLPAGQIKFISEMENRVEALSLAMRENAASAKAMAAAQAAIDASNDAQRVRERAAAYEEAAAAADRLRLATEFKNQAAGIEANAREIVRFSSVADTGAASARRLADVIESISTPTQSAARTLDGLNDIVDRSEAVFDGSKRRMSEYNAATNDLSAAMAGLQDIARTIDDFRAQEAAVAAAGAEMRQAEGNVLNLAAAIRVAEQPTQAMANDLVKAEAALERAGGAMQRETTKLAQLEAALERAGVDVRQLAVAEDQLTGAATRAAAAQGRLAGVSRGTNGFLGLNPNELQNLGYQVNDIIVSIASGQNPLTVFIQQGAQIGQIWPGAFTKIAARLPVIAAILAVVIPLGAAMGEAAQDARRLGEATANIQSMASAGANVDATKLAHFAEKLEEVGLKAKEANALVRSMMADGFNVAEMDAYIQTAEAAAKVTGEDFKTAFDGLREAFSGGFDQILEFNDATNALNETELNHIETLFAQGRAEEARAVALEAYQNRMNEAAASADGPWSRAINNLGDAWNRFVNWLSNTAPIRIAGEWLDALGRTAAYWSARLAGKSDTEASASAAGRNIQPRRVALPDPNRVTTAGRKMEREQEEALAGAKAVTAAQRRNVEVLKARNAAIAAGTTNREADQAAARAGAIFDVQESQRAAKRSDAAGKRAEAEARRRARAAAAAARQIAQAEEQLQRQLEALDKSVADKSEDNLEKRLSAIDSQYAKLFRDIDEYSSKTGGKGKIGDLGIEAARAQVEAQKNQLKNYATLEFRERELQNLLEERANKLEAIEDRVARGIISPEDGLRESEAVLANMAGKITTMADSAIAFAEGLRGAVPSPQLDAFISKMGTALQNNSGGQNQRQLQTLTTDAIEKAEGRLNEIIGQRNQLVDQENALVQLGLLGRRQAQDNIARHYADTEGLIRKHIEQVRTLAKAFGGELTPEMETYFAALEARLGGAEIQAGYVDARFTEMKNGFDQIITSGIVGFIDGLAQAFAQLAVEVYEGEGDILGFLANVGLAFADMIAKVLQGIGMLIIQMVILDAVDKLTGGLVKPLLKLYGGAGVFHEGGVVGDSSGGRRSRQVSPLIFAGAPRYHSGGIAGLAPDEMGAVLRKGEEVLQESDPRHRANGGLQPEGGSGMKSIRQVLAIGDDEIAGAMAGSAGEDTVLTHIRRNKASIKQMLDN